MTKGINDLPPELIMNIMKYIPQSRHNWMNKNIMFTCKLWTEIVETPWSVGIDYLVPNEPKHQFIKATNRNIKRMTISNMKTNFEIDDFINLLKIHGQSVVNLALKDCTFKRSANFVEMLDLMPNLKILSMDNFNGWRKSNQSEKKANSKELTEIILTDHRCKKIDECFLNCVRGPKSITKSSGGFAWRGRGSTLVARAEYTF